MKRTIYQTLLATFGCVVVAFFCGAAQAQPDPAQSADQLFNTPAGNYVRVTGAVVPVGAPVLPSPIGEAVNIPSLAGATCNLILDALPVEVIDPDTQKVIRVVPGIPELAHAFGKISWPVMISGSEGTQGNWYWNVLLKEGDCATAADSISYVVSSMAELFPMVGHQPWKCRLLRSQVTETQQIEGQDVEVNVTVSSCDPRVIPATHAITIPHSWAGRWGDLNFRGYANGAMGDRVKPGKGK